MALDRLISLAQYELEQDPYRGMLSPPATNQNTPWNQCQFVREIEDESSSSTQKVFDTCHVTCPSLVHWTELHEKEMGKRRKRKRAPAVRTKDVLGHRPTESDFQCACDYNPVSLCVFAFFGEGFFGETLLHSYCTFYSSAWVPWVVSWISCWKR